MKLFVYIACSVYIMSPHYLDRDMMFIALDHPSLMQCIQIILSVFYILAHFKPYT